MGRATGPYFSCWKRKLGPPPWPFSFAERSDRLTLGQQWPTHFYTNKLGPPFSGPFLFMIAVTGCRWTCTGPQAHVPTRAAFGRLFCSKGGGLMVTHLVYAVLAIVLAAMAVLAFDAISRIEEPGHHP